LNEDDAEAQSEDKSEQDADEDGDSDEFLDVLDVLDGRGKPDLGDDDAQDQSDEEEGEEEEEGDEEMGDAFAPSDLEEQPDGDALDHLGTFVSQLEPGKKRKADEPSEDAAANGAGPPTRKRRMLKERTEAGVEGEFGVHAASGSI